MASIQSSYKPQCFSVIHPLNDLPERKCSSEGLGLIAMTRPVRICLGILRAYLAAMAMMLSYHVLELAGAFHAVK
jgi:hypothetical protein